MNRPFKTLAEGDVYDMSGDLFCRFTGEDVERLVRDTNAAIASGAITVCLDWNHGSARGGPPAESGALGVVEKFEARKGTNGWGAWAHPRYSTHGAQVVAQHMLTGGDGSALYSSPEVARGPQHDPASGRKIADDGLIVAVALTATPRQRPGSIEQVLLAAPQRPGTVRLLGVSMDDEREKPEDEDESEGAALADPPAPDAPEGPADIDEAHAALIAERDALRARVAELEAALSEIQAAMQPPDAPPPDAAAPDAPPSSGEVASVAPATLALARKAAAESLKLGRELATLRAALKVEKDARIAAEDERAWTDELAHGVPPAARKNFMLALAGQRKGEASARPLFESVRAQRGTIQLGRVSSPAPEAAKLSRAEVGRRVNKLVEDSGMSYAAATSAVLAECGGVQ